MAKIREREREAILKALGGGVTPRRGINHIQVGRAEETKAILHDLEQIKAGSGAVRIFSASYGAGKTFMVTLAKTIALKQNMMVITADLSPDRRLYSSSGQAQALYREEIRSLSTPTNPDGGALEEILCTIDEKVMADENSNFLSELKKLPYGYDAATVCNQWHIACNPITDKEKRDAFLLKDACLRWFSGETTTESRKLLGVRTSIGDDGAWDALKLIAIMGHFAGYAGLLVELDECKNLFDINNPTSRARNYEQILRIFNECLQGDAKYIGAFFYGTPEFVTDPRKGLFSYDALRSRLISSEYFGEDSEKLDLNSPIIKLQPLSQENLLVLLGNITNVEALGVRENWLVEDADMQKFMEKYFNTLGANYYRTPREIIRSFVSMLQFIKENPDASMTTVIGNVKVEAPKKESGLSQVTTTINKQEETDGGFEDEDADFGW